MHVLFLKCSYLECNVIKPPFPPFTTAVLARFTALGIGHSFVTNNCSKSADDYARHLDRKGIVSNAGKVHTAGHATLACLRSEFPPVVAAYDPALTWDRLDRAAHWLRQGLPFLATHPDLVCHTDHLELARL